MHRKLQTNLHQLNVIKKLLRLKLENIEGLNRETSNVESRISWENVVSCFNQNVTSNVIINLTHKDINQFLNDSSLLFETKIKEFLKQNPVIKVASTFCGEFIKKSGDKEIINIFYFNTNYAIIDVGTNLLGWFRENIQDQVLNQLSEFQERDSGFALQKIDYLEININKFEMGSGSTFIKLPKEISKKRACINIQNDDQACFYWSIVSAIYPVINNNNRITSYPHYSAVLNTTNLEMPMPLNKIYKFEKLNDISVNVYALEMSTVPTTFYAVVPVRLTPQKLNKHINLLLIQNKYYPKLNDYNPVPTDAVVEEEDTNIIYHYCWIKDLSRLLSSQLNKHKQRKFICDRCLNYFSNHQKLLTHEVLCTKLNDCHISFPKYDFIEFKNHVYQQKAPFVIYADFESQLENVSFSNDLGKYQRHIPFSVGYFIKCAYNDSLSQFKMFRGTNCVEWFVNEMIELSKFIYNETKKNTPMNIQLDLSMAKRCHICEKPFSPKDEIIRDHDHFTDVTEEKFKLLTCKGVFCYDYIDSIDKLDEKTLPSKEYFYNKLEDSHIDDEKYSHASKVWDSFNIQTLGEYSDLLNCISTHNLDPSWYFTMPGYTWDCMLKYTKCKLELLHDIDQIMFIEKGIRGGVSVCSSRYSEANNKYMFDYDPVKPSKYLLYLDVNNLYGKAMCEPLPYGGFEWIEDTNFDVLTIPDDSPVGYILQRLEVRLCGVRPYWGVVNIAEALGASETPGNSMEIQDSKLGVPSGKKGAVAKTILKERRDVTGRVTMPLVRKGSVPESLMRKEEVEGAEIGFAKREEVPNSAPKGKRKRMDESIVGGEEEGPRALLEVAREQVGDVDRILKESYHPKQELVDAVSVLKSTIRSMVLEKEGKGQENRKL
ncbi:uncharacterized protein [Euwallacea fornicatus]|uniref:uncharacterized protein n=1 Tax=Euwallacea fornicatus TaxID=995702 RepID=UPI00338E9CA0